MRFSLLAFLSWIPLLLSGCGVDLSGTTSPSPFEGHWKGTWVDAMNSQKGTIEVIIGSDGMVSVNSHNQTYNINGAGTGTTSNDGDTVIKYSFPGATYGSYILRGKGSINSSGHLVGVYQEYHGLRLFGSLSIDLIKQ
jgi:hypothetical protein